MAATEKPSFMTCSDGRLMPFLPIKKPFVMTCSVDGWFISFLLRANGKTSVQVSNSRKLLVGVDNQSEAAKLAAELVDVGLWPAFANSLKPSSFAEQLFS